MVVKAMSEARKMSANPLDNMMTDAQIARRKFKAGLPRKPQNRSMSISGALGETFTRLDEFRSLSPRPEETVFAALAYYRESNPAKLAEFAVVPGVSQIGLFCDSVAALAADSPKFLGVVFVHVDTETKNPAYKTVSFCVPFMSGPEAAGRLLAAQQEVRHSITAPLG